MKYLPIGIALSLAHARAQELNQTIVGCAELGCPASSKNTVDDDCTIANSSFTYVGLTRIPTENKDLKDRVSWTKGFNVIGNDNGGSTFHSAFYLGTSPDLDLEDTGACAVLFHGIETALSFDSTNGSEETAQGTCSDAIGSSCVTALVDRAKKLLGSFGDDTPSSSEACAKLQEDLEKNIDDACQRVTKGSRWTNLTSIALSGKGAPQPLSGDKNSSSTCWPVLPKENQLTLASDYQKNGSDYAEDIGDAMYAITPILTLFFPTGNDSVVSEADASLSCLKVVGPARASLDTIDDGSDDHDNGSSKTFSSGSLFLSAIVGVAAVAWLV
ncbi:hypothetical protein NPX13_g8908 [Xylaria arbuscula]|uniref:Uncharacterized protein n=1 Tax=Xylaria arbuscula TaxID=114810 RepID=A0A9W8N7D9_9PEZI|nr:hypothetical protein NPX13_g8908 [Xylaria arbuscula]